MNRAPSAPKRATRPGGQETIKVERTIWPDCRDPTRPPNLAPARRRRPSARSSPLPRQADLNRFTETEDNLMTDNSLPHLRAITRIRFPH